MSGGFVRYFWINHFWGITLCRVVDARSRVTFLTFKWVNPFNRNRCQFCFAWPRRDNLWSRWRYQSFAENGRCVHWKYSAQRVFW